MGASGAGGASSGGTAGSAGTGPGGASGTGHAGGAAGQPGGSGGMAGSGGAGCGPFVACSGAPTVTDDDGNTYATVQICGQCWMAENLNVGAQITIDVQAAPSVNFQNDNGSVEKYCPQNQASGCASFGGLYQWDELMGHGAGPGGICPAGWHVPTDADWQVLEQALGMSAADASSQGSSRGTDEGTQLKTGGSANFDATLAGFASETFGHYDVSQPGNLGRYWTASPAGTGATYRDFSSSRATVGRSIESKEHGYSVRCAKDP